MEPTSQHLADTAPNRMHSTPKASSTKEQRRAFLKLVNRYEQDVLELPEPLERLLGLVRADLCRDASELEGQMRRSIAEAAPDSDQANLNRDTLNYYLSATRRVIRGL